MKMKYRDINENETESTKKDEGENENFEGPRIVGYVKLEQRGKERASTYLHTSAIEKLPFMARA